MFRGATIKEVENLLQSHRILRGVGDEVLPARSNHEMLSEEEQDIKYKKQLSDLVRESMLAQASRFLLGELQDPNLRQVLEEGAGLSFTDCQKNCAEKGTSCPTCQLVCTNFAEGVLTVLERDFVQLTHGKGAKLLQNRRGVQFLLTGITLGLLYESLPESDGLNELMLNVLNMMLDLSVWTHALELHGPAPARIYAKCSPVQRGKGVPFGRGGRIESGGFPYQRRSTRRMSRRSGSPIIQAVRYDPNVCSQCHVRFENSDLIQECDCGAITVRYPELVKTEDTPSNDDPLTRPRANTW